MNNKYKHTPKRHEHSIENSSWMVKEVCNPSVVANLNITVFILKTEQTLLPDREARCYNLYTEGTW